MIGLISYERKARRIRRSILECIPREIIENGCRIDDYGSPRLTATIRVGDMEQNKFLAHIAGEEIVAGLTWEVGDNLEGTTLLSQEIPLHIFPWNYKTSRIIGDLIARRTAMDIVRNKTFSLFRAVSTPGRAVYTGLDFSQNEQNPLINAVVIYPQDL